MCEDASHGELEFEQTFENTQRRKAKDATNVTLQPSLDVIKAKW